MKKYAYQLCFYLLVFFIFSCSDIKQKEEVSIPEFRVLEIKEKTIDVTTLFAANLEGIQQVELRPQVSGYLKNTDRGRKKRKKGDILFVIDDEPFEAVLQNLEAVYAKEKTKVEKASIELKRIEGLAKANIISQLQVANARLDYQSALASLQESEAKKRKA